MEQSYFSCEYNPKNLVFYYFTRNESKRVYSDLGDFNSKQLPVEYYILMLAVEFVH